MNNTIEVIERLWQQYGIKEEFEIKGYDFYDCLNDLKLNPPINFSMETLDSDVKNFSLSNILAYIPAEVVHRELGDDALMWTWVKHPYSTRKDIIAEGIQRITGRDPQKLEKARLTAWRVLRNDKAAMVKNIFGLIEAIQGGIADSIDLPKKLRENAREGIKLSDQRLEHYSLTPLTTSEDYPSGREVTWFERYNHNKSEKYVVWLDSPVGLGLIYHEKLNAVVGISPSDIQTIMIYQLQGIKTIKTIKIGQNCVVLNDEEGKIKKASSRGLMPLDWEKLLVGGTSDIGQSLGYQRIGIQGGRNNYWIKTKHKIHHLSLEEALKKYDGVAQRLGFEPEKDHNWYKKIE